MGQGEGQDQEWGMRTGDVEGKAMGEPGTARVGSFREGLGGGLGDEV